jgi:hypothetical protein
MLSILSLLVQFVTPHIHVTGHTEAFGVVFLDIKGNVAPRTGIDVRITKWALSMADDDELEVARLRSEDVKELVTGVTTLLHILIRHKGVIRMVVE